MSKSTAVPKMSQEGPPDRKVPPKVSPPDWTWSGTKAFSFPPGWTWFETKASWELLPGSESKPYKKEIIDHGGPTAVAEYLLGLVSPEIKNLEGKIVSAATLEDIISSGIDTSTLEQPMGYMSIVKDDRNPEWYRCYIGQCKIFVRRIVRQHGQEILQHSTKSLHHFMLWMGNGHRSANFITLWTLPKGGIDKAAFCKAFRTHHGLLKPKGTQAGPHTDNFGLNIMTPLVQDSVLLPFMRNEANSGPRRSPDRQIAYWPTFHPSKKEKQGVAAPISRPIFQRDYDVFLNDALDDCSDQFSDIRGSLRQASEARECTGEAKTLPFTGRLDSSIAFLLDFAAAPNASGAAPIVLEDGQSADSIPWSLRGCHFHEQNCLIWTHDFGDFAELGLDSMSGSILNKAVMKWHSIMLNESQAKIILLCGPRVEMIIKSLVGNKTTRHTLKIRGCEYMMYIEHGRGSAGEGYRLYLRAPTLPSEAWSTSARHSVKLSEIIRFAVNMVGLTRIRPYFVESSGVVGYILRRARAERLGSPPMTSKTISEGIRLWLGRKGISKLEDIREIEKHGGTLIRGLLMVLSALPRRNKERRPQRPRVPADADATKPKKIKAHQPFDPDAIQNIKRLVDKRVEEREEKYAANLTNVLREPLYSCETQMPKPSTTQGKEDSPELFEDQAASTTDSFSAMSKNDSERVANVSSLLAQRQAEVFSAEAVDSEGSAEDDLESPVEDLAKVIDSALRRGILEGSSNRRKVPRRAALRKSGGAGQSRLGHACSDWSKELEKLPYKEYHYKVTCGVSYPRLIRVKSCPITFPADMDVGTGDVFVKVELSPPGEYHPECYATEALDSDPANRLALRVRFKNTADTEVTYYEKNPNRGPLYRTNAFVDILHGVSQDVIAETERRYLSYPTGRAPPGLERFENGNYT
ncbi:hypothetical protein BJX99DRAFT_271176 [Aspergillus californicus]